MLLERVQDSVWAIHPPKLDEINAFLLKRLNGQLVSEEDIQAAESQNRDSESNYQVHDGVASIPIYGTLTKRASFFTRWSGGATTEDIKKDIQSALNDPEVKSILLDIDSPGGVVDGVNELGEFIYASRGTKKIVAFTDGMMASAGYWIGSAADEVYAVPTATVGSIGVATVHYDLSERDKQYGVTRTYLTAGKYKRIAADNAPLNDEGKEYIQGQLDTYYNLFLGAVGKHRGVDMEDTKKMADGRVFIGKQSMDVGLVDGIVTSKDDVIKLLQEREKEAKIGENAGISSNEGESEMTLEELKKDHPELYAEVVKEVKASVPDHSADFESMRTVLEEMKVENAKLHRTLAVQSEKTIRTEANVIWERNLSKSNIPTRRHANVRSQVSYEKYIKDDVLDAKAFEEAVQGEIKEWEKDFASDQTFQGMSTTSREDTSTTVDLDDDERDLTAEEKALVERNLKMGGQK